MANSNLQYTKGVRTRYFNVLVKEIENSSKLFDTDIEYTSTQERRTHEQEVKECKRKISIYIDKLNTQSEKLAQELGDSDSELTETIINDDSELCDKAWSMVCKLQNLEDTLKDIAKYKVNEESFINKSESDESVVQKMCSMQLKMHQDFFEQQQQRSEVQMKMQHEFFERQTDQLNKRSPTVRLPQIEMNSFNGNKLQWVEFWDSFNSAVHSNDRLSPVDKFNYLKGKLNGEARKAIDGISLSNENYSVAVQILRERFGDTQEIIDLHYKGLLNTFSPKNTTDSLRLFMDKVERHLRSLEVLNENLEQHVFISMIRSKLPSDVLLHLELQKGSDNDWTISKLRNLLRQYIVSREKSEKTKVGDTSITPEEKRFRFQTPKPNYNFKGYRSSVPSKHTAGALITSEKNLSSPNSNKKCRFCNKDHWSDECPRYKTIEERKGQLKRSCFKCLKEGHLSPECKTRKSCVYCKKVNAHHRSLCPEKFERTVINESVHVSDETTEDNTLSPTTEENVLLSSNETVLMQTARTEIKDIKGQNKENIRILLDSGSQRTYITERLAKILNLKKESEQEIRLVTFGSDKPKIIKTVTTKLNIRVLDGHDMTITANIVPYITGSIQRKPVKISDRKGFNTLIQNLSLADSVPSEVNTDTVDFLLGNDYYLDIILGHKIEVQRGLYLLSSKLGWILTGRTNEVDNDMNDINMLILTHGSNINTEVFANIDQAVPVKPDLEDFWNIESIGVTEKVKGSDDVQAIKNFRDTLTFRDKRYFVTWPWKDEEINVPNNRPLAVGRLKSLVSRFQDRPAVLKKYDSVIRDQLENGIIEKVEPYKQDGILHYLPHHPVIKPGRATTKLRIVYDASAKTKSENRSLNECLYRGPVLLNDLCGTLMRFRLHTIGIVSDIEKAFLQIGLQESQRDVTRFLWLKDVENPSVSQTEIQEFRFCRVPFGIISSPYLLGATIDYHLECYNTNIAKQLREDIYMDNVVTGVKTVTEAKSFYKSSKCMFREASMNLREWASNNKELQESIPSEDKAEGDELKVLGLTWNRQRDTIGIQKVKFSESPNTTKRIVLKQISTLFDPLGLYSPVTLRGKLLLQCLWKKQLEWDQTLDDEDVITWTTIREDLNAIPENDIQRSIVLSEISESEKCKSDLLCFCDASSKAYATIIYLKQRAGSMQKIEMMFSKTRLAPTTSISIPRLELMAILIGVRCIKFIQEQIRIPLDEVHLFTDSQCALKWISSTKRLSVFVSNRVREIKSQGYIKFHYVRSNDNPADLASRGCKLDNLLNNNFWWHGPEWLCCELPQWPVDRSEDMDDNLASKQYESEIKKGKEKENVSLVTEPVIENAKCFPDSAPFGIDYKRYSSVSKLLRVTALVKRFIRKLKGEIKICSSITATELNEAEKMWISFIQHKHYGDIFGTGQENKKNNLKVQLGIFLDDDGLLRCKGRLENSSLTESARVPLLLPKKDRFTDLVIEKEHRDILHSGVSQTLSKLRHKFWVPQGRATVRKVLNTCLVCRRTEGGPYKMPPMAPLPWSRVSESTPFTHVGLDYLGPLYVKEDQNIEKIWVCLFTCMVTRSVHLEMVKNVSTIAFLNCFRRFIACRGTPSEIICDNALHFKLASQTTELVWNSILKSEDVQSYSSGKGIKWRFIVEIAPWMGGFYERLVGIIKRSLRKAIGKKILNTDQLLTVLKEVEAVVNFRPLVYIGDDINSNIALTPAHFTCLNPNIGIPECDQFQDDPDFKAIDSSADKLLQIWKKGQKLLDVFWKIWREEYLSSLRERTQTLLRQGKNKRTLDACIGDVVLIKDNVPRGSWRLGKIIKLIQSADGCIRSAKIQTTSGRILGRPLCLLYPIETSNVITPISSDSEKTKDSQLPPKKVRKAAIVAEERIKKCLNDM